MEIRKYFELIRKTQHIKSTRMQKSGYQAELYNFLN